MTRRYIYISIIVVAVACREKYDLPATVPTNGYLVVDGVINSGTGPTSIRISRSLALADTGKIQNERFAHVRIEGDNNSSVLLYETTEGVYGIDQLSLLDNVKYRLHIYTIDGKDYISDFTSPRKTPLIDTISWERETGGVRLFVNTHDPQNNTRFYRWEYEETWEFHSTYIAQLKYIRNPSGYILGLDFSEPEEVQKMFTCWASESSNNLLFGSSAQLSRDTIHLPITYIPQPSWKLSVLYSINIKQYSQSEEGYGFLQRMKKNTEQVGSLFDAQPSQLIGNIHCVQDPNELVIGWVEVAELREKRTFISRSDVNPWNFYLDCPQFSFPNNPDSMNRIEGDYIPTTVAEYDNLGFIKRYFAADPICVDCSKRGVNVKPLFWP